ncbi:MAG TPA: hypothetical protein VIO64_00205 [Pseudobacteroides sp.]|uniref:hypothetical protein n=1 Tax=Pseudobacteroides sp. TaxID=1968840 RepID=UPI002F922F7B
MEFSFIKTNISRCNRNLLILNILFTLLIFTILKGFLTDYYNMLLGPFVVDKEIIVTKADSNKNTGLSSEKVYLNGKESLVRYSFGKKYYFKFEDLYTFHSGVEQVYSYDVNYKLFVNPLKPAAESTGQYIMTSIGDKYLVIKVKEYDENIKSFKGLLVKTSEDSPSSIMSESDLDIDKQKVLPFIFDTTRSIEIFVYIWTVLILIFFIINLHLYIKIIMRKINYKKHPIYNHLDFYGNSADIMNQIDGEVQDFQLLKQKIIYTDSWVLWKKFLSIGICKSSKLN